MTTIDRILLLKEEKHLMSKEIEVGAGLANSSISQWKKGKGKPSLDNIVKLANYFQVSSDYLLGLSEERHGHEEDVELTEEETLLLDAFHMAPTLERFRIIQICMNSMDAAASREFETLSAEKKQDSAKIVKIAQM